MYGDERFSRKIARWMKEAVASGTMRSTSDLASLCARAYGRNSKASIHPATRTFQALRIYVNDEMGQLRTLLDTLPCVTKPGSLAMFISFHSLEDRMVKHTLREWKKQGLVTLSSGKKPVVASKEESQDNPRSRSAKLRVCEFL